MKTTIGTRPRAVWLASAGVAVAVAATLPSQADAAAAAPPALSDQQIAAMDPATQATYLGPLRAVADALGSYGRGAGSALFTNVALDPNNRAVDLYLTDPTQAAAFEESAVAGRADVDLTLIRLHKSTYTRTTLESAARTTLATPHAYAVYSASPNTDGSGITVEVGAASSGSGTPARAAATATATDPSVGDVAAAYTPGSPHASKTWNDAKWHDSSPFIGGDVITPDGHRYCTAGLPASGLATTARSW